MSGEILLVDDDEDDAFLFRLAASEADLAREIRAVQSGEAALDLLLKDRLEPALIVLDIKMAGIDGLEVLRRLRADPSHRDRPVVLLTGSDLEADRAEAARLGCRLFLTKPSSLAGYGEMAARIKSLLDEFDKR
ncbi:MAG: response regulator [Elusimicrobiota bacterium]|nr:response regulator [Elusimicrobiota bacterium]